MTTELSKPKFRISYRKGKRVNNETGYEWSIIDRMDRVLASGWSSGRKDDAVAEAERRLDEIAAALALPSGVSSGIP